MYDIGMKERLRGDESVQRQRCDGRIGVNHEQVFVEGRVDTNNILDLMIHLQFQRIHGSIEVNLRAEAHGELLSCKPIQLVLTLFKKCINSI